MASTGETIESNTTETQETQQQVEPQLPITAKDAIDGPETTAAKEETKPKVVLTANGHYVEESTAIWDHDDKQYIDGPESQPINPQDLGNYTPGAPIKEEQLPPTINSDIVSTSDGGHAQRNKTSFNPENTEYEKTEPDSSASATTEEGTTPKEPERKQYYGENPDNLKKKVDSTAEYMTGDDKERYEKFQENKSGASEKPNVMTAESTNSITDESEVTQRYNEQKPQQVETPAETEEEPLAQTNTSEDPELDEEESVTPIDAEDVSEDQASSGEVTSPIEPEEATEEIPAEKVDVTVEQEEAEVKLNSKELVDLIHAISELNTSIVELKKVFEGNDAAIDSIEKLSITVNNFGNQVIVNNGEVQIGEIKTENIENQTNINVQGNNNETNVAIEQQEDDFEDIPEETNVQDLEAQKATLKEELNKPNLTQEQQDALNNTIEETDKVIDISINGGNDIELSDAEKEERLTDQEKAAEVFVGEELTDQEKKDFKDSAKDEKGFFAQIKRVFKGSGWKKFVTEGAKRFGSNLAISSAVGGTVALLGPVGATVVGGAMVAMGGVTLYKGIKMVKEQAKATGKTVREVWQDKVFRRGVLHSTLTSGLGRLTTMAVSGLVPGVGGVLASSIPALTSATISTGLEHGVEFFAERDFQKKQKAFLENLSSNFNYRNYRMMTDEGYLLDGTEIRGTKTINVKGIAGNLRNIESIKDKQRANFAIKSAIATQLELFNQTQDERYRFVEYTDGKETKQLDLTDIGLQEVKGESTDEYPLLEFEPSIDRYIDRIDVQQLADKIEAGWNTIESNDVENVGLRIIQNIAGLEAAEIDTILSAEKKLYYEKVRYMSGWRMGTCVVNAASAIGAGITIFGQGVAASRENRSNRQAANQEMEAEIEQTRAEIGDNDASVEIMQTENGDKVYAIDLDNDSVVDMYRTETGEIYSTSIVGAEKAFELSNGLSETDVYVTPLQNSQTGIAGTIVDNNTGEVLGVAVDGGNGTWTTMSVNELETPLSATVAGSNQPTNINISNVQPNGIATVNIDGNSYETNLASLNDIPAIAGTEGIPGGGAVDIEPGDSMPVILRKALVDASQSNENLAEAYANDPYAMERRLYQGNYLENDATIRNEANLTNPLKVENNDGIFEYKDSNLVMEYLQELNGGQPVNLPGGVPATPGQPGYNLGFNTNINNPSFTNLSPIEIDTPDVVTDIPAIPALGSIAALGLGNLFDRQPHVMTRKTTVTPVEPDKKKESDLEKTKNDFREASLEPEKIKSREGEDDNELDSIKDYRPFVESIVKRNLTFSSNNKIYTSNPSLERHFARALEKLEEKDLDYTFDNMVDVLTEDLQGRIEKNKERMDKLGQSQGIEIEILTPITKTVSRRDDEISTKEEWQEWLDRYSGRGYTGSTEHDDWEETKQFGIPEDLEERQYQTYEMSPRPSRSATEMGTIVSMLTYAGFLDKDMLDTKGEREIYSLHISTSFPEEITSNPEFENTYTQVASILSLGFASLQRLGFESYKQGGKIISVKSNVNLTRNRAQPSTSLEPLTEKQKEEMDRGVMTITEMRGFDVNNDTPSLIINKNYVDALVRMHFEGNNEATEILNSFISQSKEIVKDLGMTDSDYQSYINDPSHTRLVAEELNNLNEDELNEFRRKIRRQIRNIRSEMKERNLIDDDL